MNLLTTRIKPEKLEYATTILRAVAHPVRLSIIDLLHQKKELTVLEIQNFLNLQQPVASQHLSLLQDKGVLTSVKQGRKKYFKLKFPELYKIVHCLEAHCL